MKLKTLIKNFEKFFRKEYQLTSLEKSIEELININCSNAKNKISFIPLSNKILIVNDEKNITIIIDVDEINIKSSNGKNDTVYNYRGCNEFHIIIINMVVSLINVHFSDIKHLITLSEIQIINNLINK